MKILEFSEKKSLNIDENLVSCERKLKKIALHADLGTFIVFPFRKQEFRKKYLEFSKKILEFSEKLEFILP